MQRIWEWILHDTVADNLCRLLLGCVCVCFLSAKPVLESFKYHQIYLQALSNTVLGENAIKLTSPVLEKSMYIWVIFVHGYP